MLTKIYKIQELHGDNLRSIVEAIHLGAVVAFPTETVYGLGCRLFDVDAVANIYKLKKRSQSKPLSAYIDSPGQAGLICTEIPDRFYRLADIFLPGPLTIILKAKPIVPYAVNGGSGTIAVRICDVATILEIIRLTGEPLAGTSANLSGTPAASEPGEVIKQYDGIIEAIVDGGKCRYGTESTVISLTGNLPIILRHGAVGIDEIEAALSEKIKLPTKIL